MIAVRATPGDRYDQVTAINLTCALMRLWGCQWELYTGPVVLNGRGWDSAEDLDDRDFLPDQLGHPCDVCGERGACGYDLEGRALIHTEED